MAIRGRNIVFDAITVDQQGGFAFDVWHANHYLPECVSRNGIIGARTFASPLRGTYLSIFESDLGTHELANALPAPGHEAVKTVERYTGEDIGEQRAAGAPAHILEAPVVYPVLFRVPPEREHEFNAWYEEEHMDILLRCEHWPYCRRFRLHGPSNGYTHLALHHLTDLKALESQERDEARATAWRDRLAEEAWFKGDYRVYHRYGNIVRR